MIWFNLTQNEIEHSSFVVCWIFCCNKYNQLNIASWKAKELQHFHIFMNLTSQYIKQPFCPSVRDRTADGSKKRLDIYAALRRKSQQIKMNFKRSECQVFDNLFAETNSSLSACETNTDLQSAQDFAQKRLNYACLILEIADFENLQKSTKFMAHSILLKSLAQNPCLSDLHATILILCSLRLASKFNESPEACVVFETKTYLDWLAPNISMTELLQFQMRLFCEIGFKIYRKSPYEYLDELIFCQEGMKKFYNVITAYVDFALTLPELTTCSAEEIYAGCLSAFRKASNVENKRIAEMVEEVSQRIYKTNQVGSIIIQNWIRIVNAGQP